jgi:4-hydroxybenzoate polyprenyltransferase
MNIKDTIRLMRLHQWTKNSIIFLPLFFNAGIANACQLALCLYAFIGFSCIASSIYCINDVIDAGDDRTHPEKSKRPVASGKVSAAAALVLAILLFAGGLTLLVVTIPDLRIITVTLLYFAINLAYALKLKQTAIIDIICIAAGFVLRVVIGGFAAGVWLSHWIVLMTFLLALFLACAKRRDDVLHYQRRGIVARKNIIQYNSIAFLNAMMMITATITVMSYIMYTVDEQVMARFDNSYIYVTSVFVMTAIFRYLQITMVEENSGSPTGILLTDRFIQVCIAGWLIAFTFIIYL